MTVNLIRYVEIAYKGTGTLLLKGDVPGTALATIASLALPTKTTRQLVRFTLPTNSRAVMLQTRVTPDSLILILYSISVYAKALGNGVTAWRWLPLPIPGVGEEWTKIELPIPPTPEEWTKVDLPIPPTPEEWSRIELVSDDGTEWKWQQLPSGEA